MATNVNLSGPASLPPPRLSRGVVGWARENLFSAWYHALLTVVTACLVLAGLWYGLGWVLLEAQWGVIPTLGGRLVIGPYNIEAACEGQNCFWRPQAGLMLVMMLAGLAWATAGGGLTKRIVIIVTTALVIFAFLPYNLDRLDLDVRLLLLANVPAVAIGWALGRYTRLGTPKGTILLGIAFFALILILLRGVPGIPGIQPVSAIFWSGWRPEAALFLVMFFIGMAIRVSGRELTTRKDILAKGMLAVAALVAFALLYYDVRWMGLSMVLLALANIPAVASGWAVARYTRLGTVWWMTLIGVLMVPVILILLHGIPAEDLSLQPVSVIYWGGMMLNLLLAVVGIVFSFPIGIALALGRRSTLPVVKVICVTFIEVFRGVPLITLLFMSQVLVPLAFPQDFPVNSLLRAAIIITLFSSAYTAENIRGGLQALHPGQAEAARALGLASWQTMLAISLPQAIRNVIPAIVGQFIALFKDTTLVTIIGMLDILEFSRAFIQGNPQYLSSQKELFVFLAFSFWIFTFGMSYVSRHVERHLGVGER